MEVAIRPAMPVGWSRYIIPMNDGRFFVPYWMIETLYQTGHLDQEAYDRYKEEPKTLKIIVHNPRGI